MYNKRPTQNDGENKMRSEEEINKAFYKLVTLKHECPTGAAQAVLRERAFVLAWVLKFKNPQEVVPSRERLEFLDCFR